MAREERDMSINDRCDGRTDNPLTATVDWPVIEAVYSSIGQLPAETGGILGAAEGTAHIAHYLFEVSSRNSSVTYTPDHQELNRIFSQEWGPQGIRLRGFVHSHPAGMTSPSEGDRVYAGRILENIPDLSALFLPIVQTVPDRRCFSLHPWQASISGGVARLARVGLIVTGGDRRLMECLPRHDRRRIDAGLAVDCLNLDPMKLPTITLGREGDATSLPRREEIFDRVRDAYDLSRMREARLVIVGSGGAAEWIEQMARAGVEQFVLIDPDVVDVPNLATQQTYLKDVGRPKVECIAERLLEINPHAAVVTRQSELDAIDDREMRELCLERLRGRRPAQTLLCGFTDNFEAQARVNRLGLEMAIPTLSAQVYLEGRGAEVTFTVPGVTPACQRCVTGSRYRHIREHGHRDRITSHGTPIFSTGRLNAIKGFIALAILHHGSAHPRWGHLLERIGDRNLVQIRLDPDIAETLGLGIFDKVSAGADQSRLLFDDVVWLPQAPENPASGFEPCADCGGTGNLLDAKGRFPSTRIPLWGDVLSGPADRSNDEPHETRDPEQPDEYPQAATCGAAS